MGLQGYTCSRLRALPKHEHAPRSRVFRNKLVIQRRGDVHHNQGNNQIGTELMQLPH